MANPKKYSVTEKKVSLATIEKQQISEIESQKRLENVDLRDNYYIVHTLFFLLGLMHFLPFTFFVNANAYWMEKFRNVSADASDATTRTTLQSHFAPATTMANLIPFTICIVVSTFYGHKLRARSRILVSLTIMTVCFIIATGFIKINTDAWQTSFFIITMITLGIINAANAVMEIGILATLAKFPQRYMKIYLLGQGFAGILNSVLEVLSLATGTSTTVSALIYFLFGSVMLMITLILYYVSTYSKFYMHFIENSPENTSRGLLAFLEMNAILKIIWLYIIAYTISDITIMTTQPAITSLVVSENYGSGDLWSDVYFVPVVTFLLSNITSLAGRIAASKINKVFDGFHLCIFMLVRCLVFVPLIYLCNAQPRSHLPVLLSHDWEYIIIMSLLSFSNGYLFNMLFLSLKTLVAPEKLEDSYKVFVAAVCLTAAVLSPVGFFVVDIL